MLSLRDFLSFPGFRASHVIRRHPTKKDAWYVKLVRAQKDIICSGCGAVNRKPYDTRKVKVQDLSMAGHDMYIEFELCRVDCPYCCSVHWEILPWLSSSRKMTKRYEKFVRLLKDYAV